MARLFDLLKATLGEEALSTPIGKWRLRVSKALDDIASIVEETVVPALPDIEAAAALVTFGSFFAQMPGDNAATIAAGAPMLFPQDGPANGIVRDGASDSDFILPAIGTYEVSWQVSVDEAGQLGLALNGILMDETVAGRATGTSQISNTVMITTTAINQVLSLINPAGNVAALTITPIAGGTHAVSAWLKIRRLA